MSAGVLFGMGLFVTLVVAIGVALPIYGAILDGRYEEEQHRLAEVRQLREAPAAERKPVA